LDGFAMAKKGEAGRALGAAQAASGLANIVTAVFTLALIPLIMPIVMAVRSADMVFLMLLGISFIAVLTSGSTLKGLISGGVGLLISLIGFQPLTAIPRFTFGSLYLYDGIPLIPVALGLFGIPEMIALATTGGSIARSGIVVKGMKDVMRGVKDVFQHIPLVIRSNIIGYVVGVMPGLGASPATFIAYSQAKQTSQHPETFGSGNVEGVIAPESANNACESGALLTTLALGVPGSAPMALMLGAFIILGLVPGPEMLTRHLDLSLTLVWVVAVAGVLGLAFYLPLCPRLAVVATIPGRVLVPLIVLIAFVGAFASRLEVNDVLAVLAFTVIGLAMRKFDFNRPALFLAYILGALFERFFFIALNADGPLFFVRPISLILIAGILAVILYNPLKRLYLRRKGGIAA
ncbi:MAG: tripartite tricarboxylate transporter permease, partial [Chloroflexota bacterium]